MISGLIMDGMGHTCGGRGKEGLLATLLEQAL